MFNSIRVNGERIREITGPADRAQAFPQRDKTSLERKRKRKREAGRKRERERQATERRAFHGYQATIPVGFIGRFRWILFPTRRYPADVGRWPVTGCPGIPSSAIPLVADFSATPVPACTCSSKTICCALDPCTLASQRCIVGSTRLRRGLTQA